MKSHVNVPRGQKVYGIHAFENEPTIGSIPTIETKKSTMVKALDMKQNNKAVHTFSIKPTTEKATGQATYRCFPPGASGCPIITRGNTGNNCRVFRTAGVWWR